MRSIPGGSGVNSPLSGPRAFQGIYNALGGTDDGRQFALVHMHPCGEYTSDCPGMPDESSNMCVTPCYRNDSTIGIDPYYWAQPPTPDRFKGDFKYDVQVVVLPILEVDYLFRIRVPSRNLDWSRWVTVRNPAFMGRSGDWVSPNIADVTKDRGGSVLPTLGSNGVYRVRVLGRGITIHLDAPATADQGHLVAGQVRPAAATRSVEFVGKSVTFGGGGGDAPHTFNCESAVIKHVEYGIPLDQGQLLQQDTLASEWPARLGSYIPHRFAEPIHTFVETDDGRVRRVYNEVPKPISTGTKQRIGIYSQCVASIVSPTSSSAIIGGDNRWLDVLDCGTDPRMPYKYGFDDTIPGSSDLLPADGKIIAAVSTGLNHLASVQFLLGISSQAQVRVKNRTYLEGLVGGMVSPVSPYLHRAPVLDPRAMEVVVMMAQMQQHVFLASDNDFSSILMSIGKILPGVFTAMQNSGLPLINTVGSFGNMVGKGARNFFSHF